MKINLYNTDEFIKLNSIKKISNPILFEKGSLPTSDGLLSNEIFGTTMKERKTTCGYIDLNIHFLHPFVYKLLKRMDRRFESIVSGTRYYVIENGVLVENEMDGETGLRFLYKNWEKIDFKRNKSNIRNERIDLLVSNKKDALFTKYWIVIPPFYRDVNFSRMDGGKVAPHQMNLFYSKLLQLTKMISNTSEFDFVLHNSIVKIQNQLVLIYDYFKEQLHKKHGLLRRSLMAKTVDYGARSVISAPVFNVNRAEDMKIDFHHAGIPLSQICSLFTPFIMHWLINFFTREFEKNSGNLLTLDEEGNQKYVKIKDPASYFNEEFLKKQLDKFVHSPYDRFEEVLIPIETRDDSTQYINFSFTGRFTKATQAETVSPLMSRNSTWTDIFYQAAVDVTEDKHVLITRYPILDYFGTFHNKITVLSTRKTIPMYIGTKLYPHYPFIDLSLNKEKVSLQFLDTVTMSNLYLPGLGGDYDGDQVTVKALFSQEANKEAEKILHGKQHILNINGENMRKITNEGIQTLYTMTKFEN